MKNDLDKIKNKALPVLKRAGVTRSSIFGSYIHGENKPASDIDLLVEIPNDKSLYDFIGLKLRLEGILKKKVDLVEYSTIKPSLKKTILHQQIQIL